jgi:hypothetical protein
MERWEKLMLKFETPADGRKTEGLHDMSDHESHIQFLIRGIHPIKVAAWSHYFLVSLPIRCRSAMLWGI